MRKHSRSINTPHWEKTMNISKYQKSSYSLVAIFCAALAAGLGGPANATDLVGPDITVRYGDLAIDTEQGASTLLKRIEGAADRVCARLDHGSLVSRRSAETCSRKVAAAAVNQVNHPMLLAVFNSARGVSPPIAARANAKEKVWE
jgi:UrcA family protein